MSFIPRVEGDWLQPRHGDGGDDFSEVLSLARRLTFIDRRPAEAWEVLRPHACKYFSSSPSSLNTRREWRESFLEVLLTQKTNNINNNNNNDNNNNNNNIINNIINACGLLPLPSMSSRADVKKLDNVMYRYCALYWIELSCAVRLRGNNNNNDENNNSEEMSVETAAETSMFVVNDICCGRLSSSPRCLPLWRLLQTVLVKLLSLLINNNNNDNDNDDNNSMNTSSPSSSSYRSCVHAVRKMNDYLRYYIIRYLELRDRPVEGKCGLLKYRHIFDCMTTGMNNINNNNNSNNSDESCINVTAAELHEALHILCGCGNVYRNATDPNNNNNNNNNTGEMSLETFLDHYFFRSPLVAFDGASCPC